MKAPDKIYLHPDFEGSKTPSVFWSIEKRGSHPEECAEYIRKDALLEWANVHKQAICINGNEESAYDRGQYSVILALIDKLNSL